MTHLELEEIEKLANAVNAPDDWYTGAELQGVFGSKGNTYDCTYIAKMSPSTADRMVKRIRELEDALRFSEVYVADFVNRYLSGLRGSEQDRQEQAAILASIRAALAVSGEDVGK